MRVGPASGEARVGLIGCGRLAERGYVPALRRLRSARLVSTADPVIERCAEIAPESARFDSAEGLLAAGGLDVVIVATPAASHPGIARAAAEAGVPALVEKPPAADAEGAAALVALEREPWIGFNRRFDPRLQRLHDDVPSAEELEIDLTLRHRAGSWDPHVVRDDALLSLGPHLIDLARWLSGGEVLEVRAFELSDENAVLEARLDRGLARISCGRGPDPRDRVLVRTPGGILAHRGDGAARRLLRRARHPWTGDLVGLLLRQLEELTEALRGGAARHLARARDGFAVMAAIEAARRSAASGADWVRVEGLSLTAGAV